jgi:FtsZ-binding cell division protein ZapB
MVEHYKTEQHQSAIITFICRDGSKLTNNQHDGGSGMDVDTLYHTTASSSDNNTVQLQEVCETIDILANGIQTLNEDAQRLSNESLQLQNAVEELTKDYAALKISIQEQRAYLDGVKPNQEILQQDVSSLKQTIEDKQSVSYDGTLIWKISSVNEKMGENSIDKIYSHNEYILFLADAQSERQTSVYSPPFYSSSTGYKMRARLYLHGDGNARRTHLSLFFVLMRSEYDPILKFPFNYKVTFCLYDQTPSLRHIIDSFRPDTKSNSFQRPRSEMNIASGIPKFFPLAMIQQEGNAYVKDDTMFIKIMVDFGDMPKTLLPYALGLNPGLPTNIQQILIKKEAERRAQQTPPSNLMTTGSSGQNNE